MEKSRYKCNFSYANPLAYRMLKENAEEMRRHPTEAEELMWHFLEGNHLGIRFRHQYIIGEYIVDFVSLKSKIIIEVDGEYHDIESQREKDLEREMYLKSQGFKILRFTNQQVFSQMDIVIKAIRAEI